MRVQLLFSDRDADRAATPPAGADDLIADLDLEPVLQLMVPDRQLEMLPRAVLLNPLVEPDQIAWRQHVLADAIADPEGMRTLFELAGRALDSQRSIWMYGGRTADSLLTGAIHGLRSLLPLLQELSAFAAQRLPATHSAGLSAFYQRLIEELDPDYLRQMARLLSELQFPHGVVSRARLEASGLVGSLELLQPRGGHHSWWPASRLVPQGRYRFTLADRDEAGFRALSELRDDAIYDVAATVVRAKDHVVGFFQQLRWEAGFFVGCLNLYDALVDAHVEMCWPTPAVSDTALQTTGLRCLSLAVRSGTAPMPNDLPDAELTLGIITGANQGGKTTFLRSIGCAQLLLQAGMFVPASSYTSGLAPTVHTHFRQAEDDDLTSGKLEEELVRMSGIIDRCRPGDVLLMNESFSSTDEVEGSYLAGDIIDALLVHGVRVLAVTHFFRLAARYRDRPGTTFLAAERRDDGTRSHRVLPGVPLATSHGMDIYRQVCEADQLGS